MARPPLRIQALLPEDIDQVMELEALSFPDPWPRATYLHELTRNRYSRYLKVAPIAANKDAPPLIAQGGYMRFGEEMHILTLAVLPAWRGQSIGEWLLLALLDAGRREGSNLASLEVRVSNQAAQGLYKKLGFVQAGYRRRYYPNKEDALILVLEGMDDPRIWGPLARRLRHLEERFTQEAPAEKD